MSDPMSINSLPSAMQTAAAAINQGAANVNRDAAAVASATGGGSPSDVLPALIDSRQQLLYTQAAAKMLSTADQMLGTIIDIRA
jgi:hypothetical protein